MLLKLSPSQAIHRLLWEEASWAGRKGDLSHLNVITPGGGVGGGGWGGLYRPGGALCRDAGADVDE